MLEKGIITIAIGKKYAKQAKYLALSCMIHSPHITRAVITDCSNYLNPFFDVIIDYNKDLGAPFEIKTRLYALTPFKKTLFLDADSLIINNIDYFFGFLDSFPFLYFGIIRNNGYWYYDIEKVIKDYEIEWIPELNSGMLLFSKTNNDTLKSGPAINVLNIFEMANKYMKNPNSLNVDFFRNNMYPDEPFFALSLAKNNIKPFDDKGRFSRSLIGAEEIKINTIKGFAMFKKHGHYVFPSVVHFCGTMGNFFYFIEKCRLIFFTSLIFYKLFGNLLMILRKITRKYDN